MSALTPPSSSLRSRRFGRWALSAAFGFNLTAAGCVGERFAEDPIEVSESSAESDEADDATDDPAPSASAEQGDAPDGDAGIGASSPGVEEDGGHPEGTVEDPLSAPSKDPRGTETSSEMDASVAEPGSAVEDEPEAMSGEEGQEPQASITDDDRTEESPPVDEGSAGTPDAGVVEAAPEADAGSGEPIGVTPPPEEEEVPLVLVLLVDVAASMGVSSDLRNRADYKWDRLVDGASEFLLAPQPTSVAAALSFYPSDEAPLWEDFSSVSQLSGSFCEASEYDDVAVSVTDLPSTLLAAALEEKTPADQEHWLLGTPMAAAMAGTVSWVDRVREERPEARYAVVLLTDGGPLHCDNDEEGDIAGAIDIAASASERMTTYVVAFTTPVEDGSGDDPQANLTGLDELAEAGGTSLVVVDTQDRDVTSRLVRDALDGVVADLAER